MRLAFVLLGHLDPVTRGLCYGPRPVARLPGAAAVAARARAPGPLRVLSSAAVVRAKGLHRLVEALGGPGAGSIELDVAGALDVEPAYARKVTALVTRSGLGARVRLHG